MRIAYIADDGTEFEDKDKCMDYEWILTHPSLKDIKFYDKNHEEINDSILEYNTYKKVRYIYVPTEPALHDLNITAEYTGFSAYSDIDNIGEWKYIDWLSRFHRMFVCINDYWKKDKTHDNI